MREDLVDDHRIFDAGNHLSRAAASAARLQLSLQKDSPESRSVQPPAVGVVVKVSEDGGDISITDG